MPHDVHLFDFAHGRVETHPGWPNGKIWNGNPWGGPVACVIPDGTLASPTPAAKPADTLKEDVARYGVALDNISVCESLPMARKLAREARHPVGSA